MDAPGYWYSRFVFERALALIYLVAFVNAANQFVPLVGARGLLPATRFVQSVPFAASPSLFYAIAKDPAFRAAAWLGIAGSCLILTGIPQRLGSIAAGLVWAVLWILYLSFVNVGQTFYAFGWEALLLEMGFFAMFLGGAQTPPSRLLIWIWRWMLFRLMFGAGLIKMRGDPCWRDLTCLNYYFETQPMPNTLSWYFHWLPPDVHRAGVIFNHVTELVVPFGYFLLQPFAAVAGLITVVFQLGLIVSGNLSWLNWLTVVLCIPTLDDRWWSWLPVHPPVPLVPASDLSQKTMNLVAAGTAVLSLGPALNMLSPRQIMNYSYNPLHLVNTYGAFGSITKERNEIVLEGTSDAEITPQTVWREYEFRGKPGDPAHRPPQVAPYHLRLDWLMWFAAMSPVPSDPWFPPLMRNVLRGDTDTLGLFRSNPFPNRPPRYLRALYYRYWFTTPEEHAQTGRWWRRQLLGVYVPPLDLRELESLAPSPGGS
jgi:Lipase maturation factor